MKIFLQHHMLPHLYKVLAKLLSAEMCTMGVEDEEAYLSSLGSSTHISYHSTVARAKFKLDKHPMSTAFPALVRFSALAYQCSHRKWASLAADYERSEGAAVLECLSSRVHCHLLPTCYQFTWH